jgi:hypothetical protein
MIMKKSSPPLHCSIAEKNFLYEFFNFRQIKKTEVGRTRSTYGGRGEIHTGFWWGNLREGDHLKDPGVDRRIILKWIFDKRAGGV